MRANTSPMTRYLAFVVLLAAALSGCSSWTSHIEYREVLALTVSGTPTLPNITGWKGSSFIEPTEVQMEAILSAEQWNILKCIAKFESEHGFKRFGKTGFVFGSRKELLQTAHLYRRTHGTPSIAVMLEVDWSTNTVTLRDLKLFRDLQNLKQLTALADQLYADLVQLVGEGRVVRKQTKEIVPDGWDLAHTPDAEALQLVEAKAFPPAGSLI